MIPIVNPQFPDLYDINEFNDCLGSGQVTNNGKYVQQFETALHGYLNSKLKPLCFCNGEMALFNLIQAHKIKYNIPDGSGVLVPSFTFVGTINAIVLNGLKPIFCDVDETLTDALNPPYCLGNSPITMIIIVGVYGNLPDIDFFSDLAGAINIPLIFDNAPAFGSKYKGEFPNHYGHSEIYSFHATKQFSTMEGGCAVVNDPELHQILIELRDFGQYEKTRGDVRYPGLNSKMMEICALIGLQGLDYADAEKTKRQINYAYIKHGLRDLLVEFMKISEHTEINPLYFPLILPSNAEPFVKHMSDNGVHVRRYYTACHTLTAYKSDIHLPFTDSIKDRIVALPCYGNLTNGQIEHIINAVKKYFK